MNLSEFEKIAQAVRPRLVAVGLRFFRNADDADDVAQDVLLKLWTLRERLDAERSVEALAVTTARNYCLDLIEKKRADVVPIDDTQDIFSGASPEQMMEAREEEAWLLNALGRLPKAERRLMIMRQREEMELDEMAAVTGMSKHTISQMLSVARKRLLNELKKTER